MKRKLLFLALLFVGLVGCTYNTLPDDVATPIVATEQGFDLSFATRAEVFDGQSLDSKYFVAEEDLESYLNYKQQHSGKKNAIKDYSAYGFDGSHTLFYVLNYADGWEVVSADKRTQATLAYGESGSFSMGADNTNEAEKFWMEMLASDVLQKRQRNKSQATRSEDAVAEIANDEEQARVNYWNRICANNGTRVIEVDSPSALRTSPYDNVYLLGSIVDSLTIKKGPYLQTKWGQVDPWNKKCPYDINNPTEHSKVGCVAVAGGQLLYFFRKEYAWNLPIPTDVYVDGFSNNYDLYIPSVLSNSPWNAMALVDSGMNNQLVLENNTANLLVWIGRNVSMKYSASGSSAKSDSLRLFLYNQFGISSKRKAGYDRNIIVEQLYNKEQPIYLAAGRTNGGRHAWIADGYKSSERSDYVYYLVTTETLTTAELAHYTIENATHFIKYELNDYYVHMNWGWGGDTDIDKDGYYFIAPNNWNSQGAPYDQELFFFYDFSKE